MIITRNLFRIALPPAPSQETKADFGRANLA